MARKLGDSPENARRLLTLCDISSLLQTARLVTKLLLIPTRQEVLWLCQSRLIHADGHATEVPLSGLTQRSCAVPAGQ